MIRCRRACFPAVLGLLLITVTGCSVNNVKYVFGPPKPQEILRMPGSSGLKDARVTVTGHVTSGAFSADLKGDGIIVVQPKAGSDLKVSASVGAIPIAIEFLTTGGKSYQRSGTDKWVESKSSSPDPGAWSDAKDSSYVGEDTVAGSKAWHVNAKNAQGGCVRTLGAGG
jgi:hypothetical protein